MAPKANTDAIEAQLRAGQSAFYAGQFAQASQCAHEAGRLCRLFARQSMEASQVFYGRIYLLQGAIACWVGNFEESGRCLRSAANYGKEIADFETASHAHHNLAIARASQKSCRLQIDSLQDAQTALNIAQMATTPFISTARTITLICQIRLHGFDNQVADDLEQLLEQQFEDLEPIHKAAARLLLADAFWRRNNRASAGHQEISAFHETQGQAYNHKLVIKWMTAHKDNRDYHLIDPRYNLFC